MKTERPECRTCLNLEIVNGWHLCAISPPKNGYPRSTMIARGRGKPCGPTGRMHIERPKQKKRRA